MRSDAAGEKLLFAGCGGLAGSDKLSGGTWKVCLQVVLSAFHDCFCFSYPHVTLCWPSFVIPQLLHGNYSPCECPSAHRWQLHGAMQVEQWRTGRISRTWKCNHGGLLARFVHHCCEEVVLPFPFSFFPLCCAVVGKPSEFGWKMDLGRRKVFIN